MVDDEAAHGAHGTERPLTRRQLREIAKQTGEWPVVTAGGLLSAPPAEGEAPAVVASAAADAAGTPKTPDAPETPHVTRAGGWAWASAAATPSSPPLQPDEADVAEPIVALVPDDATTGANLYLGGSYSASPLPYGNATDPETVTLRRSRGQHRLGPGEESEAETDPGTTGPGRRGPHPAVIVLALVAVAILVGTYLLGRAMTPEDEGADTLASAQPADSSGPLFTLLDPVTTVAGGEYSSDGLTGVTYTLDEAGWVALDPLPDNAREAYVGEFTGSNDSSVSLVASGFSTSEAALADATATAEMLGEPIDTGWVFPTDEVGTYWVFNNNGDVVVVWTDGDTSSFLASSNGSPAAYDLYTGLPF